MNKCYGFGSAPIRWGGGFFVFVLVAAFAVLALLMGAVTLVTGPVALAMLAGITLWLLVFAGRSALARRGGRDGSR